MEEIISLIVANGIFAVLFCGLLVYELRDSRTRESRYVQTIKSLSDRLKAVSEIKTDTAEIKTDVGEVKSDTKKLVTDADVIKNTLARRGKKDGGGGGECATAIA